LKTINKKSWNQKIKDLCEKNWSHKECDRFRAYMEHLVLKRDGGVVYYEDQNFKARVNKYKLGSPESPLEIENEIKKQFKDEEFRIPEYLMVVIDQLEDALRIIETELSSCREKYYKIEDMILDIRHDMELKDFDAISNAKLFKEFKSILRLRRNYKDKIDYLNAFRCNLNLNVIDKCKLDLSLIHVKKENRKYHNRITDELKQELLNEYNNIKDDITEQNI
jgi:hypothetical protein